MSNLQAIGSTSRPDLIRKIRLDRRLLDSLISKFIYVNGAIAILAIVLIFVFLVKDALPMLKNQSIWHFISGKDWQPEFDHYGLLPLFAGSAVVTIGAVVMAVPIGIACAVYLAEVAPKWIREIMKPTIEVLAGIPSVVVGFIGIMVVAPFVQSILNLPTGMCALTASLMLGFMSMPTIISIAEDALVSVPKHYRDSSYALGATKWETIVKVVMPAAKSGMIAGCMLGIGRAVGETMTVLMVAGNATNLPEGLTKLMQFYTMPVKTMTATIAADMGETVQYSFHYHTLFAVGVVLFVITFLINLVAETALRKGKIQ
jgi:phosphate transport system permease protein